VSDNKYWNAVTETWEASLASNAATQQGTSGTWVLAVTGEARRSFAGTTVVVEARALQGALEYTSATSPQVEVR